MRVGLALILCLIVYLLTAYYSIWDSELVGWLHFSSALVFMLLLPWAAMNGVGITYRQPRSRPEEWV